MDCKQREHVRKKWKGYGTCITFKKYSEKSNENPCFASLWRGKSEKRSGWWEGYKKRGRPTSLRERKGRWGKGEGEEQWNPPPLPLSPSLFDAWRNPAPCWILKMSRFALTPSAKLLFLQSQSSRQPFCYCPQSSMTTTALRTNMNKQLSPAQKIRLCYIPKHDARWVEERREAWYRWNVRTYHFRSVCTADKSSLGSNLRTVDWLTESSLSVQNIKKRVTFSTHAVNDETPY